MKAYSYDKDFEYHAGWDAYALSYAHLPKTGGVYMLTKLLMYDVIDKCFSSTQQGARLKVLDINCGTGNDFQYFLDQGWQIIGTDGATGMLNKAHERFSSAIIADRIKLFQLRLEDWDETTFQDERFDLIYSVTGGFSYIDDKTYSNLIGLFSKLLATNGRLIIADLNKRCLAESIQFLLKGEVRKAFRRKSELDITIQGQKQHMYLRTKSEVKSLYQEHFDIMAQKPLLAVTPPYQSGYRPPEKLLSLHKAVELRLQSLNLGTNLSDQIITVAKHKQQ